MSGPSLQRISAAFKQWRASRPHKGRIPAELWALAVEGAKEFPLSHVAKAAALDFYQLRSRVEKLKTESRSLVPVTVTKVMTPPLPSSASNLLLEVETRSGAKLRFFNESESLRAVLQHLLED